MLTLKSLVDPLMRYLLNSLSFIAVCFFAAAASAAEAQPDYARDIAPLFKTYCNGCHNGADREGKLSLESYADLLQGGAGGVAGGCGRGGTAAGGED